MVHDQDLAPEPRPHGDVDFGEVDAAHRGSLARHLLVALQTRLVLGLARLGGTPHPLELALELLGELGLLLALGGQALRLCIEIGRVVALVRVQVPAVDLADPLGYVVEEVAVMRDGEHGALVVVQVVLEPQHRLGIEVVGRLVEQQQVGLLEQKLAQRDAPALASREHAHGHIGIGALERVHRLGELAVDVPAVGRVDLVLELAHLLHERIEVRVGVSHRGGHLVEALDLREHIAKREPDVLDDRLVLVQRRLLLEDANGKAGGQLGLAVADLFQAGHDLEQRRFAHAVGADDADLRTRVEAQGDIVEDDLAPMGFSRLIHLVNKLGHEHVQSLVTARAARTHMPHSHIPTAPPQPKSSKRRTNYSFPIANRYRTVIIFEV